MNEISNITQRDGATMTSREIADLVEKRHPDVLRDIRTMLEALEIGLSSFAHSYLNAQNKEQPEYRLPRDLTMTLVTGYSIPLRKKVIDRLDELERRVTDPVFVLNDPASLRGLLGNYAERVLQLESHVADLLPKADALGRIAEGEGSFCVTDAAKTLQVQPKALFAFLRSHRWIYTRPGSSVEIAYQDKLAQGLLEHKTTTVHRSDGSEKVATQVRVTPKGLARLGQELPPIARAA